MERECLFLVGEIERGNKKEINRYKYRYYIVLYNHPRSILTPNISSAKGDQISLGAKLPSCFVLKKRFAPQDI